MRALLVVFLALHGIAHLPGFLMPWRLVEPKDSPYTTTIAGGWIDVGPTGIRVIGILWLVGVLAFVLVAIATAVSAPWWRPAAIYLAAASLVLTILGWPRSRIGLVANLVILLLLAFWRG